MPPPSRAKAIVQEEKATRSYVLLRRRRGDIRLGVGTVLIGRGTSCDVVLTDPRVSRRHARLTVGSDSAVVEDLSANGVFVNGGRIEGKRQLKHGDVLRLGGEDLQLLFFQEEAPLPGRREVKTVQRPRVDSLVEEAAPEDTDTSLEFEGLEGFIDDLLARGGGEDAEKLMVSQMGDILRRARAGELDEGSRRKNAALAARLAAATGKGRWIDYAVELFALAAVPPPADVLELLEAAVSVIEEFDVDALGTYARSLRAIEHRFTPEQRALVDRVEELEHSAGWGS